jgi:cbb3-type cytochrome oxidase subunit 3
MQKGERAIPKDNDSMRLIASAVLAFVVMLFINGFIGSMGGFPTFIAYVLTFYQLRTMVDKRQASGLLHTGRLLGDYIVRYLLLWTVFRVGLFFSRVTGWGNIRGMSALEYVKELLATSVLEKWAYFFAAALMLAFVLSLFPLVVVKSRVEWTFYALVDGAAFALLCSGINALCLRGVDSAVRSRATCLTDALLLRGSMKTWQIMLWLLLMILFLLGEAAFVFWYARRVRRQNAQDMPRRRWMLRVVLAVVAGAMAAAIVAVIILLMPADSTGNYEKVAEFLTADETLGPIGYRGRVYIPDDEVLNLYEVGTAQGYLAAKNETCESRFYQLAVANLLYTDKTGLTDHIQMKGEREAVYVPVEEQEQLDAWQEDTVFLIWDEEWLSESAYSHVPTGYTTCNADLIEGLAMQFPQVTYRLEDFADYDAYFTIRAYPDLDAVTEQEAVSGDWVGCILVKDDKFYFGSYENQITGICQQQIREVLGGN